MNKVLESYKSKIFHEGMPDATRLVSILESSVEGATLEASVEREMSDRFKEEELRILKRLIREDEGAWVWSQYFTKKSFKEIQDYIPLFPSLVRAGFSTEVYTFLAHNKDLPAETLNDLEETLACLARSGYGDLIIKSFLLERSLDDVSKLDQILSSLIWAGYDLEVYTYFFEPNSFGDIKELHSSLIVLIIKGYGDELIDHYSINELDCSDFEGHENILRLLAREEYGLFVLENFIIDTPVEDLTNFSEVFNELIREGYSEQVFNKIVEATDLRMLDGLEGPLLDLILHGYAEKIWDHFIEDLDVSSISYFIYRILSSFAIRDRFKTRVWNKLFRGRSLKDISRLKHLSAYMVPEYKQEIWEVVCTREDKEDLIGLEDTLISLSNNGYRQEIKDLEIEDLLVERRRGHYMEVILKNVLEEDNILRDVLVKYFEKISFNDLKFLSFCIEKNGLYSFEMLDMFRRSSFVVQTSKPVSRLYLHTSIGEEGRVNLVHELSERSYKLWRKAHQEGIPVAPIRKEGKLLEVPIKDVPEHIYSKIPRFIRVFSEYSGVSYSEIIDILNIHKDIKREIKAKANYFFGKKMFGDLGIDHGDIASNKVIQLVDKKYFVQQGGWSNINEMEFLSNKVSDDIRDYIYNKEKWVLVVRMIDFDKAIPR